KKFTPTCHTHVRAHTWMYIHRQAHTHNTHTQNTHTQNTHTHNTHTHETPSHYCIHISPTLSDSLPLLLSLSLTTTSQGTDMHRSTHTTSSILELNFVQYVWVHRSTHTTSRILDPNSH